MADIPPIQLDVSITQKDYVRAQWLHMKPRPVMVVLGVLLLIIVVGVFVTHAVTYWIGAETARGDGITPWAFLFLVLLFGVVFPWQFRRAYRSHPGVREPGRTTWSADGVLVESTFGRVAIPWRLFVRYREGRNAFLVYQAPNLFNIVPKRLMNEGDADRFRELLSEQMGKAS